MNADDFYAELPGLLDELKTDVIRQEIAFTARTELGICFPGRYPPAFLQFIHRFQVAKLVGIYASVEQQAMHALHSVDDIAYGVSRLDGEWFGIRLGGDEGEYHHI